jgi:S1-C subfamily serine protease
MDQHEAPAEFPEPISAPTNVPAFAPPLAPPVASTYRPWSRRRTVGVVGGIVALSLGIGSLGLGIGITALGAVLSGRDQPIGTSPVVPNFGDDNGLGGSGGEGRNAPGTSQGQSQGQSTTIPAVPATDAQKVGLVTIVSNLFYSGQAQAAGTGMIISSTGEILTNNHVVQGATTVKVTIESTNVTYDAKVLGTDSVDDIALLQIPNVSGLSTVSTDPTSSVTVGQKVTSIGNAEGTGNLVSAAGPVSSTSITISVNDEVTGKPKKLANVIEVAADVVSGDSGGPLVSSSGKVIGIVTAASVASKNVTGYAIPISRALGIVSQIQSGTASANVHIGSTAFFGVNIADKQGKTGITISGVVAGKPAAAAGLTAGDVITAVNGTSVLTPDQLTTAVRAHAVGDTISVTYTTPKGKVITVKVILVAGPIT